LRALQGFPSVLDIRLGVGLVATNPIKQAGSGVAAPVALTQPVGNFVGNTSGSTAALVAWANWASGRAIDTDA